MGPSISVVIPTYNRVDLLLAAIASALDQDPAPAEVLVCDNGSTDATAQRVLALAATDARVRLLPAERPSGGPAAPRNRGLRAAAGEWVAFLDDDDAWRPGKLAAQVRHLGDADVVAGNAVRRSDGRPYFAQAPDPAMLARDNVLITSSVLARTALLRDAGGFPEGRGGVEDYVAWLALADRGARIRILPDLLVDYRDEGEDRFGARATRVHRQLAALHLRRWARRPLDRGRARVAAGAVVTALRG